MGQVKKIVQTNVESKYSYIPAFIAPFVFLSIVCVCSMNKQTWQVNKAHIKIWSQRKNKAQGRRESNLEQKSLCQFWNRGLAPSLPHHTLNPSCPTGAKKKGPPICKEPPGDTSRQALLVQRAVWEARSCAGNLVCTYHTTELPLKCGGDSEGWEAKWPYLKSSLCHCTSKNNLSVFFSSVMRMKTPRFKWINTCKPQRTVPHTKSEQAFVN